MVGSVNNVFQPQAPITNTFRPGEQNANAPTKAVGQDTVARSNDAPDPNLNVNITPPDKTEQINSKLALSRDNSRPSPDALGSSAYRGTALDITV